MRWGALAALALTPTAPSVQFPSDINLAETPADVTILGIAAYDGTGYGFTSGDFDGDTRLDIAVLTEGQISSTGYVFFHIFWGDSPLPTLIDLASYPGHASVVRAQAKEVGTYSWITSGDFNADGRDDIALGIPCRHPFANCDGKAYIIFGTPAFPDSVYLGNPGISVTTIHGIPGTNGALGSMMASGDMNGDGYDDLIVSASEIQSGGQVYLILGRPVFPPSIQLASSPADVVYLIDPRYSVNSGTALACGDLDGDGFDDVVVGTTDASELRLVSGSAAVPDTISLTDPAIKRLYGARVGWRTELADFNGDHYLDIVASANWYYYPPGCESCGGVVVAYGSASWPASMSLYSQAAPVTRMFGTGITQHFGEVLSCGDVNGDGFQDVLISSAPDRAQTMDVGKVTIVYGSAAPPDTLYLGSDATVTRIYAESRTDYFARGLHARDIDADGAGDVLVGATYASAAGRTSAGKAYVIHGAPVATPVGPSRTVETGLRVFPNPFNPLATIRFRVDRPAMVRLSIHDVRGGLVRSLADRRLAAGEYNFLWDGTDNGGLAVASGVYFCKLTTSFSTESRKMVLVR